MHAGFEVYRAFLKDGEDVKKNIKEHGKMKIPVLASGGESSPLTEVSNVPISLLDLERGELILFWEIALGETDDRTCRQRHLSGRAKSNALDPRGESRGVCRSVGGMVEEGSGDWCLASKSAE